MKKMIGKKQLVFLIEDIDGEIFGYYLNTQIVEKYEENIETDAKSFLFNLQSKNNRLPQPMKFEIQNWKECGYKLYNNSYRNLITLGDIWLCKENTKYASICQRNDCNFNYHGIDNALCGKTGYSDCFEPERILVIQMK